MAKRFNICTRKTYVDKQSGLEKVQWLRIGNLVYFPAHGDMLDGYKLELYMYPATTFHIFEDKPREGGEAEVDIQTGQVTHPKPNKQLAPVVPRGSKVEPGQIEYPSEEINPDDIPF